MLGGRGSVKSGHSCIPDWHKIHVDQLYERSANADFHEAQRRCSAGSCDAQSPAGNCDTPLENAVNFSSPRLKRELEACTASWQQVPLYCGSSAPRHSATNGWRWKMSRRVICCASQMNSPATGLVWLPWRKRCRRKWYCSRLSAPNLMPCGAGSPGNPDAKR